MKVEIYDVLKNWANNNQGVLAIILFLTSLLVAWLFGFFKWLLKKSDATPNIKIGGDNLTVGGDIIIGNKKSIYSEKHEKQTH